MRSDHELGMNLRSAARLISDSEYVVCLVGAGISVESGIPPFRGTGGLWTRIGEPAMDGYQRFLNDPEGQTSVTEAAYEKLKSYFNLERMVDETISFYKDALS